MKFHDFSAFYKWLVVFSSIMCAFVFAHFQFDIYHRIYVADLSHISFLIMSTFLAFSVVTGIKIFKICKYRVHTDVNLVLFVAETLKVLGLMGTIIGLLIMLGSLGPVFSNIQIHDNGTIVAAMKSMILGLHTAFYATLSGYICSVLLNIQAFILRQELEE